MVLPEAVQISRSKSAYYGGLYFPSSSGWIKYHYTNHTRLDGHGFRDLSNLTLGDSYKVQLEVDPNSASNINGNPHTELSRVLWD